MYYYTQEGFILCFSEFIVIYAQFRKDSLCRACDFNTLNTLGMYAPEAQDIRKILSVVAAVPAEEHLMAF